MVAEKDESKEGAFALINVPALDAVYQSISAVGSFVKAENLRTPGPQIVSLNDVGALGILFIVATTDVLVKEIHPLEVIFDSA